ncbi:SGNH/GDSL hydrolase family protein [Blastopirellula sp. JC732]|uniref:SGNH/GDSL hydrolase family protein n=1 Tax=Blastopirellula sediminis TaxID=2894196 RepID=A0A9X1MNG3_9BACT|nr:SGNH/GDSL hydrolase family protein [Blastopirellula sediminis]MCC9606319.1 SGNH/GDSL hydrolase family protein [Blastopirellula sediminis]MCC9630383.1 SGNH/GDSL hydrolase family protein [Blastopirellula sediminis]
MSKSSQTYLALGDSMSIDFYTQVDGGGAVAQFHRFLGDGWTLIDRTEDGGRMEDVPLDLHGDVITLTIGGNDLLWNQELYLREGIQSFLREHEHLLRKLRGANPDALMIIGDIYHPDAELSPYEVELLEAVNRGIRANCLAIAAECAPIYETFRGHEKEYLCLQIEPNLRGAEAIAGLFRASWEKYQPHAPAN